MPFGTNLVRVGHFRFQVCISHCRWLLDVYVSISTGGRAVGALQLIRISVFTYLCPRETNLAIINHIVIVIYPVGISSRCKQR